MDARYHTVSPTNIPRTLEQKYVSKNSASCYISFSGNTEEENKDDSL